MNTVYKKIIEEFEEKFENTKTQLYKFSQVLQNYTSCGNEVKDFLKQSHITTLQAQIQKMEEGKNKDVYDPENDRSHPSMVRALGYNEALKVQIQTLTQELEDIKKMI